MEAVLIPLIVFGSFFAVVYVFLITRNKERLALIEKGADAKLFKSGPSNSNVSSIVVINIAFLAIGIGIGVLLGSMLEMNGMDDEVAYPSMIFICGGVGLLSGFYASRKLINKKKE